MKKAQRKVFNLLVEKLLDDTQPISIRREDIGNRMLISKVNGERIAVIDIHTDGAVTLECKFVGSSTGSRTYYMPHQVNIDWICKNFINYVFPRLI